MKTSLKYGDWFWFCFAHMFLNAFAALTIIGIYFSFPYTVKKFTEKFAASLSA